MNNQSFNFDKTFDLQVIFLTKDLKFVGNVLEP